MLDLPFTLAIPPLIFITRQTSISFELQRSFKKTRQTAHITHFTEKELTAVLQAEQESEGRQHGYFIILWSLNASAET